MEHGDDEWKPPTEAERKILEAKRERSNKISQLMGTYLLKGYKMLATTCPCGTILMRTKEGEDYCVACAELSTDVSKDDPAVSSSAAERQAAEDQMRTSLCEADQEEDNDDDEALNLPRRIFSRLVPTTSVESASSSTTLPPPPPPPAPPVPVLPADSQVAAASHTPSRDPALTIGESIDTVLAKLAWSSSQLRACQNPDACIQWCKVVQQCADTTMSLYMLKSKLTDTNTGASAVSSAFFSR